MIDLLFYDTLFKNYTKFARIKILLLVVDVIHPEILNILVLLRALQVAKMSIPVGIVIN